MKNTLPVFSHLESARLILRKPLMSDASLLFDTYTADKRVTRYATWRAHQSVAETEAFLEFCISKWNAGSEFNYIIESKDTHQLIGMARVGFNDQAVTVGYVIAWNQWNKGYATEATKTLIAHLFSLPEVDEVQAFCDVDNKASEKVMIKSGMKYIKRLPAFIVHPNLSAQKRDCVLYGVSKEHYGQRES